MVCTFHLESHYIYILKIWNIICRNLQSFSFNYSLLNMHVFVCQVCSLLCSSVQGLHSVPHWLRQSCGGLLACDRPPGVSLYLCHGALAMLSWKGALPGPQWEQLLLLVPKTLLELDVR